MGIWLITGCSGGLGRGTAEAALKHGEYVAVTARRTETLQGTETMIADYDVLADRYRKENCVNNRNQAGDPVKGGEVIVETVLCGKMPQRLLLGSDAAKTAEAYMEERLDEIRKWKEVSVRTDYSQE